MRGWQLPQFYRLSRYQMVRLSIIAVIGLAIVCSYFAIVTPFINQSSVASAAASIQVIDGDTVRSNGTTYRLVGFNTPEAGDNARCDGERQLANRASQRLRDLIAGGQTELQTVRCACQPGTEGTERCNYGRSCAVLRVEGRDVASIMISEGLAERYACSSNACPPRRSWCN